MWQIIILACFFGTYLCVNVPLSQDPPKTRNGSELEIEKIPQFVMLTYDDAITIVNWQATYQKLFTRKNPDGTAIRATFFVSHDNTNYQLVNDVYIKGHEIASHTITHQPPSEYWKSASDEILVKQIVGQRDIISKFASIPKSAIKGYRQPFLQTAGDTLFDVLSKNGFTYDSSMPTLTDSKPFPIFPYTLDEGFRQDCVIDPCPKKKYPGFWEVPIVDYWRKRVTIEGQPPVDSPCSMVDFCLPPPANRTDAKEYFMSNFKRHHLTNRSPFPVFLHETFLSQNQSNKDGYFDFIDELLAKPEKDVFFVTIQEVIEWMENPVTLEEYRKRPLKQFPLPTRCPFDAAQPNGTPSCRVTPGQDSKEIHFISVCGLCPQYYPRFEHTTGTD